MRVSKRLRFEILRRDNHACRYCGAAAPDVKLVIDHVIPDVLGGKTEPGNLVASCEACNSGKTSTAPDATVVADVNEDAIRWGRAMAAAAEIHRARREEREAYVAQFLAMWNSWSIGPKQSPKNLPLGPGWHSTIERWFAYGLELEDVKYAIRAAMENERVVPEATFRYFCGVCWNLLRDVQNTAADLFMAEADGIAESDGG